MLERNTQNSTERIAPKKSLGQNFLIDKNIQLKIVDSLNINKVDTILEIGPGEGAITEHLVSKAREIHIVDLDKRSIDLLSSKYADLENLKFYNQDILSFNLPEIDGRWKVIGNLPYYISSQILFYLIERRDSISSATIMVQKEVAERLTAQPKTKEYGKLSVLLRSFAKVSKVCTVSPNCFFPRPKVWSQVVKIYFVESNTHINDFALYWSIVKSAFSKRRKMLRNTLSDFPEIIDSGIDLTRRPEELSVSDFKELYDIVVGAQ
ncbi:MAG: 16S rRNA (adenine(1518)-N(6)/adenine(1519)-N(6)) -dimethyltransferase RsmA [Candidatus Kapaibacteriales bacterium]